MSTRARPNHRALRFETLEKRSVLAAIVPGFDEVALPPEDDSPTANVSLPFAINFYGNRYEDLWVNNNGNVTFDRSFHKYVPFVLTTKIDTPIIAPFFADVDTGDADDPIGQVTYGFGTYEGRSAFGATYTSVGYFNERSDRLNTFQVLIVDRSDRNSDSLGSDFDIVFNYDQVQWDRGSASQNQPAVAGFSNGTGDPGTFFQMNGSLLADAFFDSNPATGLIYGSRGSDVAGRYVFEIRDGQFVPPPQPPPPPTDPGVVVPVPYFPPAPIPVTSSLPGLTADRVTTDLSGSASEIIPGLAITSFDSALGMARTIFGTGSIELQQPTGNSAADPVDSIEAVQGATASGSGLVEQVEVLSTTEDPIVSLLAALPIEHEEVALNAPTVKISGQVWHDADGDQRVDQLEEPLMNCQVFLDLNGNSEFDPDEPNGTTDLTGTYAFEEEIAEGDYLVRVVNFRSTRAGEPNRVRITMQSREVADVNFAVPVAVAGDEVSAALPKSQPRAHWTTWLAGAGAVATLGVAGLLGYAWRRKRASTYTVWHTRITAPDPILTRPSSVPTALVETVCETEEKDVSKNAG